MNSAIKETRSPAEQTARIISFFSISPFQIITYITFSFVICNTVGERLLLNLFSGIFYLLIPFIPLYYITKRKKVQNYSIHRQDRFPLLLFQVFGFAGASVFYYFYPTFAALDATPLFIFTVGYTILNLVCIPITVNFKFKISLHMTGATASITALFIVMGHWWAVLYLFCVPIAWSRVKLKAHTFAQVLAGSIAGILTILLTYLCFGYFS